MSKCVPFFAFCYRDDGYKNSFYNIFKIIKTSLFIESFLSISFIIVIMLLFCNATIFFIRVRDRADILFARLCAEQKIKARARPVGARPKKMNLVYFYSSRKASMGFMAMARRAGMSPAKRDITKTNTNAPSNILMSIELFTNGISLSSELAT